MHGKIGIKKLAMVSAIAATMTLAGCGGGGAQTASPGAGTQTASLTGTVIDGYIEGATICLDLNVNQACDSGEPSAVSKADGTYAMDISGLTADQIKAAHLFTLVPVTAKDKDDGGKTLGEAGKASFNLMAPASAFVSANGKNISSAVISPLTTLVSHDMIAGNGKSLDDAEKAVRTRMDLPAGTDLKQDFVEKGNAPLIKLAQVVAAAIGEVKKAAHDVSGTSDRDALFAALNYLQQNVAALQIAVKDGATGATVAETVKAALSNTDFASNISEAKMVTASSAVNIEAILAGGFYDGDCLLNTDCGGSGNSARYAKTAGSNGKWQGEEHKLVNGQWSNDATSVSSGSDYTLTATGWVLRTGDDSGTYIADGQGGGTATQSETGKRFRFSAREVDISNQTASSIAGLSLPSNAAALIFAPGSKLFWMQSSPLDDEYRLHAGFQLSAWNNGVETKLASIEQAIATYPTATAGSQNRYLNWSNVTYTFDLDGTGTGGTVSLWNDIAASCPTTVANMNCLAKTGSAPYEIRTVSGQKILIIKAQDPKNSRLEYVLLAAMDGKLYGGSYQPAGAFEPTSPSFNKTAINTVMKAAGKPEVLN